MSMPPGSPIVRTYDVTGVKLLTTRLNEIPKNFHARLRAPLRAAGQEFLQAAMAKASWSSRIPHALSLRVSFSKRRSGISVVADSTVAPHARPYEGIVYADFRHPTFGHWPGVNQDARPYIWPAARSTRVLVLEEVDKVLDAVLRDAT